MKPIYLDYNATTPILAEVAEEMLPYMKDFFGNPSSSHWYGRQTRAGVEQARGRVAALLGCDAAEIIFTSGGSEANNLAIKGIAEAYRQKGNHIITSRIEHPAVAEVCKYLKTRGFEISWVSASEAGIVDPEELEAAIRPETILITVMHANNEVGTIQPIAEISKIAKRYKIVFHSDGAQAVGKIPTPVESLGVDLYSLAGHKCYAPKGVGVLYIRQGITPQKQMHGADHEKNMRAGTENILEIVGLGKACELAQRDLPANRLHLAKMRDRFESALKRALADGPPFRINGHPEKRLPNTSSISFSGIEANRLLSRIEDRIAVSAGAACHSDMINLSATLKAMQVPVVYAMGTLRISTGKPTTISEIDQAVEVLCQAVRELYPGK